VDPEIFRKLLKKAAALIAHRALTRRELRQKLVKLADEAYVESVLDHLENRKLLNDADYAYNFALYRMQQKGWGPAKVKDSLLHRHVDPTIIEDVLLRVRSESNSDTALVEYMQKYCGSHWPPADPKKIQRLILHLRRRGFDRDHIYDALKEYIPAEALQRFETGE
jgi:regulatory protein